MCAPKRKRRPSTDSNATADDSGKRNGKVAKSGDGGDITVKFFGQTKKLQKIRLASESIYFSNMFSREKWAESEQNTIELKWHWPIGDTEFDADEQNKKDTIEMYRLMFNWLSSGNYRCNPAPVVVTRSKAAAGSDPEKPRELEKFQHQANFHIRTYQIAQFYQFDKLQVKATESFDKLLKKEWRRMKPLKQDFIAELYSRIPHGGTEMKDSLVRAFDRAVVANGVDVSSGALSFLKEEHFNLFAAEFMMFRMSQPSPKKDLKIKLRCNPCHRTWSVTCKPEESLRDKVHQALGNNLVQCTACLDPVAWVS